jgi:hypothetical protein
MSDVYSPNIKLATPSAGQATWNNELNANRLILDAINAVGDLAVTTHEIPSASLLIDVAAGLFLDQASIVTSYAGSTSNAVTLSTTSYVYLTNTGTLTINTTGFPAAPTLYVPLAVVVAGATTIVSVSDRRVPFTVVGNASLPVAGGTLTDGANVAVGTTTGTTIATSTSQKLGFFGKTPIVQPTVGAATASSSWTSVEQAMLQAVHDAFRALGLGS